MLESNPIKLQMVEMCHISAKMAPKEQKLIGEEHKTSTFDHYKYIQQGMRCDSK